MIEIDGSTHSGSGTLLRYAVALATVKGEPLHMKRIRAKRPKPGLRPQHLAAVQACARISGGAIEGAEVGSQEIVYRPGPRVHGGEFRFDIGTAGSATMAAFTLIPPALFASRPSVVSITGGLFQDFAPTLFHMEHVLIRSMRAMGADVKIEMIRPGYFPKGGGRLKLAINPTRGLQPLKRLVPGRVRTIRGTALASNLREQQVARRMADRCSARLLERGLKGHIEILEETDAIQRGAALALWAETDTGCLIGADQAGKQGRRSEDIADFVVSTLLEDLDSGATTDRHLADQLILLAALAPGTTEYTIPAITEHVEANLWLVETILGARSEIRGRVLRIEGIGWKPLRKGSE